MISNPHLDWNTPQAEHTAEHVAAPQQLAPIVASYQSVSPSSVAARGERTVPMLGRASRGSDSNAPMMA